MRSSKIFFASTICALSSSLDMDLKSAALVGLRPAKESALASSPSARTMRRAPRCWTALRRRRREPEGRIRGGWGRGAKVSGRCGGGNAREGAERGGGCDEGACDQTRRRRGSRAARRGARPGSRESPRASANVGKRPSHPRIREAGTAMTSRAARAVCDRRAASPDSRAARIASDERARAPVA